MQGCELDPGFADANSLRQLQLLDGLWWKEDRAAVPQVKFLRSATIWDYHDSAPLHEKGAASSATHLLVAG